MIIFSRPADFTPVCTTEFVTFASIQEAPRGSCGAAQERAESIDPDMWCAGWSLCFKKLGNGPQPEITEKGELAASTAERA